MYDINRTIQLRTSYAKGYRAPQIFDEDLHIETSTARKVIHRNDPDLIQETSHSIMASAAFNHSFGEAAASFLVEGFYTMLQNPFANEFGLPNTDGEVVYTRVNSDGGAIVNGVNLELTFAPSRNLSFNAGFTVQESQYEEEHEFGEKRFFRTPRNYGFFAAQVNPIKKMTLSATGTYTGKMLVPYWGSTLDNPEEGELRTSNPFFDLGMRLSYDIRINGATMQLFAGAKNIFNSYQSDFDIGAERDPGYMYGPNQPRAIYFGIRIGNGLK
jgi:outer membrane receptor for ferrienterochelin and colicins